MSWLINDYTVRRWYYTTPPQPGDTIHYIDGTQTTVATVGLINIALTNGTHMIRHDATTSILNALRRRNTATIMV